MNMYGSLLHLTESSSDPCSVMTRQMRADGTPLTAKYVLIIFLRYLQPAAAAAAVPGGALLSHLQWIPSQRDPVYLAVPSLSGPSVETQHHNRMMADQGEHTERGQEAAPCCDFALASSISRQFPGVWSRLWMIDENGLREQNELLTIFSGAKHTVQQMGPRSS